MNKIINNKWLSLITVSLIYLLTIVLAIFLYRKLNFEFYYNVLICDVFATLLIFIFSLIFNNASMYDPYWSVAPIVIITSFFINNEYSASSLLIFLVVSLWGVRLTLNWAYTFGNLTWQDWRYRDLKEKTGKLYFFVNLFGIHLFPTIVVYFALLPALFVIKENIELSIYGIIGAVVSILAVFIQGLSDLEMHQFRKQKTGKLIDVGLWKYSRHPNYLGEILMWVGIAISSVDVIKKHLILGIGFIIVLAMFLFISIPMADKHQARKEGFSEYKKRTRMLLPIPRLIKKEER